jgi:hypothetical protein
MGYENRQETRPASNFVFHSFPHHLPYQPGSLHLSHPCLVAPSVWTHPTGPFLLSLTIPTLRPGSRKSPASFSYSLVHLFSAPLPQRRGKELQGDYLPCSLHPLVYSLGQTQWVPGTRGQ